jgi:energy-coupling factor transport system substrate-specific component
MKERPLSLAIYALGTLLGLMAFLYPFLLPVIQKEAIMGRARAQDAPLLLTVLVGVCFVALLLEVQAQAGGAKLVALLGILVSINSLLRFVEVAIPGPGGISPIFFLIVLTGYVYGGGFGFLMGSMTLLVSGLITGGIGPWLPYQMFTAGWIGLSAPMCRPLVNLLGGRGKWREVVILAVFGAVWGLVFGAIMNIWFWPFAMGPANQQWQPGIGIIDLIGRYLAFYVVTSLPWDMTRLVGNVVLILTFGMPTLRALQRFQRRFAFTYQPDVQVAL